MHVFYEGLGTLIWSTTSTTRRDLKTTRRVKSRPKVMLQKLKPHQSVSTPVNHNCAVRESRTRVRWIRRLNSHSEPLDFGQSFSGALDDIEGTRNGTFRPAAAFYSQALAGALVFNPSFKRALESGEDEPLGNKRVKVTDPQNLSPQARQVLDNNELGMELIRQMSTLKHEKKCCKSDMLYARRYAVCFSAPLGRL